MAVVLALVPACGDSGQTQVEGPASGGGVSVPPVGSMPPPDASPGSPATPGAPSGEVGSPTPGGGGATTPGSGSDPGSGQPPSGVLTAGDWDDNLNFSFFQKYLTASESMGLRILPHADRVVLTVRDEEGRPVSNARVSVASGAGPRLEAPTATDGRLLFLPTRDGAQAGETFTVTVSPPAGQPGASHTVPVQGSTWELTLPGTQAQEPSRLDVAFVLDTTGSMGDEISYLKSEFQAIADTLSSRYPQVSIRYGLVVYRDEQDAYVTRAYDFVSDANTFRSYLQQQSANGGGDYPEAMERGLHDGVGLSWRPGNTARLLFLVADAPTHTQNHDAFLSEAQRARVGGIKIYPVAASGVAEAAEFQMRQAAWLTRGRYLFLTNDSGVGGPHAEPHIPCYQVQLLKHVLLRAIGSELEGRRLPASGSELIRTVGSPSQDGACTLQDGSVTYY